MKRMAVALCVVMVAVLLCSLPASAADSPRVTVKVKGLPGSGVLALGVGESRTFEVTVKADVPFTTAMAMPDAYYPGRSVFWHDGDHAGKSTEAVLYMTITAKSSTADLAAVCDWPTPGECWPDGVAPVAIAVGARYAGGVAVGEYFPFAVVVP